MRRKALLAFLFAVLLAQLAAAAAERRAVYPAELEEPLKLGETTYSQALLMFPDASNVMAVIDGSIETDGSTEKISGKVVTEMNIKDSNGNLIKQTLSINGNDIVASRTTHTSAKGGNVFTIVTFKTKDGTVTSGDYTFKCVLAGCTLSVEMIGTKQGIKPALVSVLGIAEIRHNDAAVNVTDISRMIVWGETSRQQKKTMFMTGFPLKKTSRFGEIMLQSSAGVRYISSLVQEPRSYLNEVQIFAPAFLRNVPKTSLFDIYGEKARLKVLDGKKELISISEASVGFQDNHNDYVECVDTPYACIMISPTEMRIKAVGADGKAMASTTYPTGKTITFDRIKPEDKSSTMLVSEGKTLQFTSKKVNKLPPRTDEFSFKTDFTAMLYSDKDKKYHEYKCIWKQKKCFYDGKPARLGFADVTLCESDADCRKGEFCSKDADCKEDCKKICIKDAKCERYSGTGPVKILFVGDGYDATAEGRASFRNDVAAMMDYLHSISPFDSLEARAVFSVWGIEPGSIPARLDGAPLIQLTKNYRDKCKSASGNEMDYAVVLSKGKAFRAYSSGDRNAFVVPVGTSLSENDKRVFVHEFGHMFADLFDEYLGPSGDSFTPPYYGFPNCAKDEIQANSWLEMMGYGREAYGDFKYRGCGGDCPSSVCSNYIRPSKNSIMNNVKTSNEFNEPSKWAIKEKLREAAGFGGISPAGINI